MSGEGDEATTRDIPKRADSTTPQRPGRSWSPPAGDLPSLQWEKISELVETALELAPEERLAWLGLLARREPGLVSEVRRVLEWLGGISPTASAGLAAAFEADPQRIGAYRLVELIGRGGMGSVYLAERADREFEHQVAIKLVAAGLDAPIVNQRFLAERQILARLEHPNIARLYEGGTAADGRPYFVLEYIEGQPIDRWCDVRKASLTERLELFLKVCDAVAYAHRNLVVHRDIKPGNILVDAAGQPKLLDFGIAKVLDPSSLPFEAEATRTAQRAMTPGYASPEQISGGVITTATDVFSLGVLLYKLLTGQLPRQFPSLAPAAMLEQLQIAPVPASDRLAQAVAAGDEVPDFGATTPGEVSRRLAGDLDNILAKALRLEPESRYSSVAALAEDLSRFLAGEPVLATRGSALYRLKKAARRHRWPLIVAASLLAISFGWALMLSRQVKATVSERDRARATRDFLVELLRSADEQGRIHKLIPLEDLLARGLARLEDENKPLEPEARADLFEVLGDAFILFADRTQAIDAYQKALSFLPASEKTTRIRLLRKKGSTELYSAELEAATASFRAALADVEDDDVGQRAELTAWLAMVAERQLDTAAALAGFRQAAQLLGSKGLAEQDAVAYTLLQNYVYILDRNFEPRAARDLARRAYRHFHSRVGPNTEEAYFFVAWMGMVDVALGDAEAAIGALLEAQRVQKLRSHDHDPDVVWLSDGLSAAYILAGRSEEGMALQAQVLVGLVRLNEVNSQSRDTNQLEILVRMSRCDLLRRLGKNEEIAAEAQRILELLAQSNAYQNTGSKDLQGGVALAFLGRLEEAREAVRRGLAAGWGWSRTVAVLEPLGVLPTPLPRPAMDLSLPPELEAMLGPPPAEPLPWERPKPQ